MLTAASSKSSNSKSSSFSRDGVRLRAADLKWDTSRKRVVSSGLMKRFDEEV